MFYMNWDLNVWYRKGDIVYLHGSNLYYVCCLEHHSNNLTYPNCEDIYWVRLDVTVITNSASVNASNVNQDTIKLATEEELIDNLKRKAVKRKLKSIEDNIQRYKRSKVGVGVDDLRERLLLLNLDVATKSFVLDRYENTIKMSGSDYSKGMTWLHVVSSIPFGRYKQLSVKNGDSSETLKAFFNGVKRKLDNAIYGLDEVKQEILEFIARKITNPYGKGHVLALCGPKGTGKTKIIKSLAEALDLPFFQVNCGGLNDVSVLTGHSETYVGSKPGKIVEAFQTSNYMNPIIYLDEIDKISNVRSCELNGVFTHLLDEEQNNKFQDNYLSNVSINLSRVFFVIAFNDISKVDEIVSDRMKVIYINKPSLEDKLNICYQKIIPDIMTTVKFDSNVCIEMDREVIEYIAVHKCEGESGVRQLRKAIEKVFYRLNYDLLIGESINLKKEKTVTSDDSVMYIYHVTTKYVDICLPSMKESDTYLTMYM
jgi:ATP-dependent Lon protease